MRMRDVHVTAGANERGVRVVGYDDVTMTVDGSEFEDAALEFGGRTKVEVRVTDCHFRCVGVPQGVILTALGSGVTCSKRQAC